MADGGEAVVAPAETAGTTAASESTGKRSKQWLPLESNPEVLNSVCEWWAWGVRSLSPTPHPPPHPPPVNTLHGLVWWADGREEGAKGSVGICGRCAQYCGKLGLPLDKLHWTDVMSVEDWALEMVPGRIAAVTLLYPIKEHTEEFRAAEAARIAAEGQALPEKFFFTKQTVGNACGTVAVFHAVGNASSAFGGDLELPEDSYFARFFRKVQGLSPDAVADAMEEDDELEVSHTASATDAGNATEASMDVETHFICFVHKDGHLLELDGRKASAIEHGPTSADTLLKDAVAVIRQFMERDPEEYRFTILALTDAEPEAEE
jgi:ubiquitin carboxyl-terminal hydrolase L3